jgi:hypothetical protein
MSIIFKIIIGCSVVLYGQAVTPVGFYSSRLSVFLHQVGWRVMGIDDTIERRWGKRITARGIYREERTFE